MDSLAKEIGLCVSDNQKVLVAIPAYNEEECIENTICELRRVGPRMVL